MRLSTKYPATEVPGLKPGDVFLFEGEPINSQGHTVEAIFTTGENIIIEYVPEWTPVANASMFTYGTQKFYQKYEESSIA